MESRSERTDEYAHNDRTAGQAEAHRRIKPHAYGHTPQKKSQNNTDKNGNHVGFIQPSDGIAQFIRHTFQAVGLSYHGEPVAHTERQFRRGHQLYPRPLHAAHVHAVTVAERSG